MNFTDVMLERVYGEKAIDECELETLRLDNARLREENENLKAQFRADTKRIHHLEQQYLRIMERNKKLEKYKREYYNMISTVKRINKYIVDSIK